MANGPAGLSSEGLAGPFCVLGHPQKDNVARAQRFHGNFRICEAWPFSPITASATPGPAGAVLTDRGLEGDLLGGLARRSRIAHSAVDVGWRPRRSCLVHRACAVFC